MLRRRFCTSEFARPSSVSGVSQPGAKMPTASLTSSLFPEAMLPFLSKRPSSSPTRVDNRLFRARLTKPHRRVKSVQKNWPQKVGTPQKRFYSISNRIGFRRVLLFDLYKDAEHLVAVRKRDESLGIRHRSQSCFNAHGHAVQQLHDGWGISLGEIDRGIVREHVPSRDALLGARLVALDPCSGRHTYKSSRTRRPLNINGAQIYGRRIRRRTAGFGSRNRRAQAFPPICNRR